MGDDPRTDPFLTFQRDDFCSGISLLQSTYVYSELHSRFEFDLAGSVAFILEFLALPSFLFVQVVAIAAIMFAFDFFAPSNGNLNDITLVHVKMNIAVVGSLRTLYAPPVVAWERLAFATNHP